MLQEELARAGGIGPAGQREAGVGGGAVAVAGEGRLLEVAVDEEAAGEGREDLRPDDGDDWVALVVWPQASVKTQVVVMICGQPGLVTGVWLVSV